MVEKFYKWYIDWYKTIMNEMSIIISLPNELLPFKEDNVVIIELFKPTSDFVLTEPHLKSILEKADEFGITIYIDPEPKYPTKNTKQGYIFWYREFGFVETPNEQFMKRFPKTICKMNKIQILEMLVYDRLDELIEKGELKNSQVYKSSEGEVELTYVGSQLFCYWYDHYSELLENYEQGEKQDNLTIERKLSTRTMIDPPSGWRFGFPKEIPKKVIEEEGVINWLVDNGYPQSEIDIFKDGLPYRIYEI